MHKLYDEILVPAGLTTTAIAYESGRAITGPYGYLVSTVLHQKTLIKLYWLRFLHGKFNASSSLWFLSSYRCCW